MPVFGETGAYSGSKPEGGEVGGEETHLDLPEEDSCVIVRKRKRRRVPKRTRIFADIPGVVKITLSQLSQKIIRCIVGEDVTGEKPWILVKKDNILDNLELHEDSSEFLPLKPSLVEYPRNEILIGYIPSEISHEDNFYICLTNEACDRVTDIIAVQEKLQEERLQNTVCKKINKYKSATSAETELEVECQMNLNNRPLYQIILSAEYPLLSYETLEFRYRMAGNDRHEYTEVLNTRFTYDNIHRKRIDTAIQKASSRRDVFTQTFCTYPKNVWTQYSYTYKIDEELLTKLYKQLQKYMQKNFPKIYNWVHSNGHIDLYNQDYQHLVMDESTTKPKLLKFSRDYTCLYDLRYCKGKMVSSVCWHPFWTGTLAVAYADLSPFCYLSTLTRSSVVDDWHSVKPVLLWSFKDTLYPKLCLQSPREVKRMSFCPYDPNLLAGGCKNGQVIVWDLTNKLHLVEDKEILSQAQEKYRSRMQSKTKWMKNIKDLSLVKYAVISDLEHSHSSPVTSILWLPCDAEITKTGKLRTIPKYENRQSRIFVTSSRDGTIRFWDLLSKPKLHPGSSFYRRRHLKRLPEYPPALISDVSPYSCLNRILKPIYMLNVVIPESPSKNFCLTCLHMNEPLVYVKPVDGCQPKKYNMSDRIIYEINSIEEHETKSEFVAGGLRGEFLVGKWEGYTFNSGETVNFEGTKLLNIGVYHDGPIVALCGSRLKDYVLSIGGSIFCIWKSTFLHKPIFWKKSNCFYTNGNWNVFRPAMFKLVRNDGKMELWNLTCRSDKYSFVQSITAHPLTNCRTNPLTVRQNAMAVADTMGALRILYVPHSLMKEKINELEQLEKFLEREIERKAVYQKWHQDWIDKYAKWVKTRKEPKEKVEIPSSIMAVPEEPPPVKPKKEKPPPGQRARDLELEWKQKENERMRRVLLEKKHLNKKMLEKQQLPLKKIQQHVLNRKKRHEDILKKSDEIFSESVAMFFPEVIKKGPPPQESPYEYEHSRKDLKDTLSYYNSIKKDVATFIKENPFENYFTWKKFYLIGKLRRMNLDPERRALAFRQVRHASYKLQRNKDLENKAHEGPSIPRLTSSEIIAQGVDFDYEYELYGMELDDENAISSLIVRAFSDINKENSS